MFSFKNWLITTYYIPLEKMKNCILKIIQFVNNLFYNKTILKLCKCMSFVGVKAKIGVK